MRNKIGLGCLGVLALALVAGCGSDDTTVVQPTYVQVDRMAVPALNTALINKPAKEDYNRANPANDVATYRSMIKGNIEGLRLAVATRGIGAEDVPGITSDQLTDVICPDVVTINFAQPLTFPNGRAPTDDVINLVLGLVLNRGDVLGGGGGVSDAVNANDSSFLGSFPYLAAPHKLPKVHPGY